MRHWKFEVNINTPDTIEGVLKLKEFVDNYPEKDLGVSRIYGHVIATALDGRKVYRTGYDFKFWFDDETIAKEFASCFNGKVEVASNIAR